MGFILVLKPSSLAVPPPPFPPPCVFRLPDPLLGPAVQTKFQPLKSPSLSMGLPPTRPVVLGPSGSLTFLSSDSELIRTKRVVRNPRLHLASRALSVPGIIFSPSQQTQEGGYLQPHLTDGKLGTQRATGNAHNLSGHSSPESSGICIWISLLGPFLGVYLEWEKGRNERSLHST